MLTIKNVSLSFGGIKAVQDVNCEVLRGEVFSIIGPNGAGKTSLFNTITGLYHPQAGEITLDNQHFLEPFTFKILLQAFIVGMITIVLVAVAYNAQDLWSIAIINNYTFRQPFQWLKAITDGGLFIRQHVVGLPLVAGGVGAIASVMLWLRARLTPAGVSRRGIARTFQNIRLLPHMSVRDNIILAFDHAQSANILYTVLRLPSYRRYEAKKQELADELLLFVGLHDKADWSASGLSYGLQRRLEIARALALNPKILLLDEPAAGLNTNESEDLVRLIQEIRHRGITVILIEHHMKVVMGISDRILVMDQGKVLACGTPDVIKNDPQVIRAYLGEDIDARH